jgi:glutamate N-acetyltransferase/amino-acid N-acetyltransferase
MATMLAYILTDLDVPRATLDACLKRVVKNSFNCISVDGDQSTSDTVLALSSQCVPFDAADEKVRTPVPLVGYCVLRVEG